MINISEVEIFGYKLTFSDDLDLMRKVINLYAKVINIELVGNFICTRHINALSFYVLKGYSKETKTLIKESLGINTTSLNQINAELTKKGFLTHDPYNFRQKHLSENLKGLRKYFMEGDYTKLFMVNSVKEESG